MHLYREGDPHPFTEPIVLGLRPKFNDVPEVILRVTEDLLEAKMNLVGHKLASVLRSSPLAATQEEQAARLDRLLKAAFNPNGPTSTQDLVELLTQGPGTPDASTGLLQQRRPKPLTRVVPGIPKGKLRLFCVYPDTSLPDVVVKLIREHGQNFLAEVSYHTHFAIQRCGFKVCSQCHLQVPPNGYEVSEFELPPGQLDYILLLNLATTDLPREPDDDDILRAYGPNVP